MRGRPRVYLIMNPTEIELNTIIKARQSRCFLDYLRAENCCVRDSY